MAFSSLGNILEFPGKPEAQVERYAIVNSSKKKKLGRSGGRHRQPLAEKMSRAVPSPLVPKSFPSFAAGLNPAQPCLLARKRVGKSLLKGPAREEIMLGS
jgi:hypothetical protein